MLFILTRVPAPSEEWRDQAVDKMFVKKLATNIAKNPETSMPAVATAVLFPVKQKTQEQVHYFFLSNVYLISDKNAVGGPS